MSNAIAAVSQYTPEQMHLIVNTIAKGATPDELKLFLYRCQNMGLDPLKPGQIHFVKYGDSPGTIVVGIEGFRIIAERTGKKSGVKRGVLRDEKGVCVGAWAEVYRSDWKEPAREEVPLAEYFKAGRNGRPSNWDKMPETMIKKVAEAAALRMAFPDVLGGVYVNEEMDQAERSGTQRPSIGSENPGLSETDRPGMIYYGYYQRRMPQDVDRDKLEIERDRLATLKDERALHAFTVIDEYLKLSVAEPEEEQAPAASGVPQCSLCKADLLVSKYGGYYCPNYKDKARGEHTSIKASGGPSL